MSNESFRNDPLPDPPEATPTEPLPATGIAGTEDADAAPEQGRSSDQDGSRAEAAKDEARQVGREGQAAGKHVADTAKDEAQNVAAEAKGQAQNLARTLQSELSDQAAHQQQRAAEGLRSFSDELHSMADNSEQPGMATQWVKEAAGRLGSAAGWLDERDPASVLNETKRFARNRPVAFLAIAAGAGLLAGRLARGLKGAGDGGSSGPESQTAPPGTRPEGEAARGSLRGGIGNVEPPEETLAQPVDGYPSEAPGYPATAPGGRPSSLEPTFPDDGARGLS
ncbi:hypothetical protein [Brevibacterium renqingii]|uniref:hypothetical protein n=1 Tax=Brevibacterium renqingii TaxID=2776916 RepID=UPI001AE02423|nr:hypothetical protein [Brevibacterium renqingii]